MTTHNRIVITMLERYKALPTPHMERLALGYDPADETFHIGLYDLCDEPVDEGVTYTSELSGALAYCKHNGWSGGSSWKGFRRWLKDLVKHPEYRPWRSKAVTYTGLATPNSAIYSGHVARVVVGGLVASLRIGGDDAGL